MDFSDLVLVDHRVKYPKEEDVPLEPGIYAWFYDFNALRGLVPDKDKFIKELAGVAQRLRYPELDGSLRGQFSERFKGHLEHRIDIPEKLLSSLFADQGLRDSFVSVLAAFTPLGNPIYIGITEAQTLRARYTQHIKAYEDARKNPAADKRVLGARHFERDISPRNLIFGCLPVTITGLRDVKMAETLLNRLFRPILGRR